jgi:hypothetical protein
VLPLQIWLVPHCPQLIVPPQPFETDPQLSPPGQVVLGVQPHTPVVPPPPQVSGALHEPPVQHGCPLAPQATQALPEQIWFEAHVPQLSVPPQPSGMVPHWS